MENSRAARRLAEKKRVLAEKNYIDNFKALFHNSIAVLNTDVPKRYLIEVLLNKGKIAYDLETGLYLPCNGVGVDIYGLPQEYILVGYNGYTINRKASEVVILRSNDLSTPLMPYMAQQARKIVDYDMAIEQNLEACKTMVIAEVDGKEQMLSLVNEFENRRIGSVVCYVNKNNIRGSSLSVQSTGATYLVDKLQEARMNVLNETLTRIGVASANIDKRERVQAAEINASMSYAVDNIRTLIDTFNYDAKVGNIDIKLEPNNSLIELYNNSINEDIK